MHQTITISKEELTQLYIDERKTPSAIGAVYGCTAKPIRQLLKMYNIPMRSRSEAKKGNNSGSQHPNYITPPPKDVLERLYDSEHMSMQKIGESFGCSEGTVFRWLNMYNIHVRSQSEARRGKFVGDKSPIYITPPPKEELERLYINERKSKDEICVIFHCSPGTVGKWLGLHNIATRVGAPPTGTDNPNYITPPPKKELERLYTDEKKTSREIASMFNCGITVVGKWLRMYEIPIRRGMFGDSNPAWCGGISFKPYCHKFHEILKEEIRERDGRVCQKCAKTEEENMQKLSVHHIHYDKENCEPDLIALCRLCNLLVNTNRDYWEAHFMANLWHRGFVSTTEEL